MTTRIAPGNGSPTQPSIDSSPVHAAGTSRLAAATGESAMRVGNPARDGADRPAPLGGFGSGHGVADAGVFLKDLKVWEGVYSNLYVDTRGFVTTGIGHLLKTPADALKLPWLHSGTGRVATAAEVKAAFARVAEAAADFKRANPKSNGLSPEAFEQHSDLVLPSGLATKLATDRLNGEFLKGLRKMFPAFDSYPMPAQRALVDMAYNLGVAKLEHKFPNLVGACRKNPPDFATAAAESHRSSCRQSRNDATRNLFEQASRLTASVQQFPREIRL